MSDDSTVGDGAETVAGSSSQDQRAAGQPNPSAGAGGDDTSPKPAAINLSSLTQTAAKAAGLVTNAVALPNDGGATTVRSVSSGASLEDTQRLIALILLATLIGIILLAILFGSVIGISCWISGTCATTAPPAVAIITTTIQPLFTAIVGLVGSVVGFYFGSQKNSG